MPIFRINSDLQSAIDALPAEGGQIIMAAGVYPITATIRLRRGVKIIGESWGGWNETGGGGPFDSPVKITCADPNVDIFDLTDAPYCHLENLQLVGAGSAGTQIGIKAGPSAHPIMPGITMYHVLVQNCGSHGVQLKNCYLTELTKLLCVGNLGNGLYIAHPDTISGQTPTNPHYTMDNCWFLSNGGFGMEAWNLGPAHMRSCSFQNNAGVSNCRAVDSTGMRFDYCNWEQIDGTASPHTGLELIRCASFDVHGIFSADTPTAGRAMILNDCHHFKVDNVFCDHLTTAVVLMQKSSSGCYAGSIGKINIPNAECPILDTGAVEGTDYFDIQSAYVQQFASDAVRDHVIAVGYEQPLKLKGSQVYVLAPTSPTKKRQQWSGSAWENSDT